jgi:hypothetical protein
MRGFKLLVRYMFPGNFIIDYRFNDYCKFQDRFIEIIILAHLHQQA